ncbi:hypothetical protein [Pseudomonas putida]|uniref:hypothetical protein n=1 Tax=Pseudomonas putida TaxID=303 RepID=UPI003D9773C0
MSSSNVISDPLHRLNLPPAVKVQTLKLLARIRQAASADELWCASDRAFGFVLRLETIETLDAGSIQALYGVFDAAATARRQEEPL